MVRLDLGGALGGAGAGAGVGSMFGPIGTGIGALGGGALGLFGGGRGKKSKMKPYNQQALDSLQSVLYGGGLENNPIYGAGSNYLQDLLSNDPGAYESFAAPYKQQFEQETIPMIAERFAGMGTGAGAGNSSALYNSLGQAGKNFSTNLASLRSGLQMQALPLAFQYAQQPQQNRLAAAQAIPNQYYERPGQEGPLSAYYNAYAQGGGGGGFGGFQNIIPDSNFWNQFRGGI